MLVHTKARVRRWTVVRVLPTASVLRWGAVVRISTNHDSQQRMRGQFIFQRKRHKKWNKIKDDEPPCQNVLVCNAVKTASERSVSVTSQ